MSIVAFSHLGVRSSTQITVFWQTKALLWPSFSVSAGEARLQQRPAHSRPRLHRVKSLTIPVRRHQSPPPPPTATVANRLGTGGTAATVFTGQCAQPTGPIALSPKRGRNVEPHTQAHTHTCNPSALPDTPSEPRALNTYQCQVAKLRISEGDIA